MWLRNLWRLIFPASAETELRHRRKALDRAIKRAKAARKGLATARQNRALARKEWRDALQAVKHARALYDLYEDAVRAADEPTVSLRAKDRG